MRSYIVQINPEYDYHLLFSVIIISITWKTRHQYERSLNPAPSLRHQPAIVRGPSSGYISDPASPAAEPAVFGLSAGPDLADVELSCTAVLLVCHFTLLGLKQAGPGVLLKETFIDETKQNTVGYLLVQHIEYYPFLVVCDDMIPTGRL